MQSRLVNGYTLISAMKCLSVAGLGEGWLEGVICPLGLIEMNILASARLYLHTVSTVTE